MLEVLVHLEIDPEDFPATMQLLRIEVPDSVSQAQMPTLPAGWSAETELTRGIGNQFLDECNALLLPVPSAIIPSTVNYLFNPRHPEAQSATIQVELFTPDSRLF
jgi:RES domain-containing protein